MGARLKEQYSKEIAPRLKERLQLKNIMEVPRIAKIVVNMGVGDARDDQKFMDAAIEELTAITGQKPQVTRARTSISGFKLRAGQQVGCCVTLRGDRMYEFLDRLVNIAIPRIRDFRGLSPTSFDHVGNYNLGLREQLVFPEVNFDKLARVRGMNITIVIKCGEAPGRSLELLKEFGMPFRQPQQKQS